MTFEQLEAFVAVTEYDTLFDAAEALHISQSALSKQIQKLEKELDLLLLDRTHRRACLTPAGEQFSREAKILLRQYQHMMKTYNPTGRTGQPSAWAPCLFCRNMDSPPNYGGLQQFSPNGLWNGKKAKKAICCVD